MSLCKTQCEARIITDDFTIEGTTETCYKTRECGAATKKSVAEGEDSFAICTACAKRYKTKSKEKTIWLGWFDCDWPPTAHVQYSPWYYDLLEKVRRTQRDSISQQIMEIEQWMRGEGKILFREQPKKLKQLLELRAKLK